MSCHCEGGGPVGSNLRISYCLCNSAPSMFGPSARRGLPFEEVRECAGSLCADGTEVIFYLLK